MWTEGEEGAEGIEGAEAPDGPQEVEGAEEEKPQRTAGLVSVSGGGKTWSGRRRFVAGTVVLVLLSTKLRFRRQKSFIITFEGWWR